MSSIAILFEPQTILNCPIRTSGELLFSIQTSHYLLLFHSNLGHDSAFLFAPKTSFRYSIWSYYFIRTSGELLLFYIKLGRASAILSDLRMSFCWCIWSPVLRLAHTILFEPGTSSCISIRTSGKLLLFYSNLGQASAILLKSRVSFSFSLSEFFLFYSNLGRPPDNLFEPRASYPIYLSISDEPLSESLSCYTLPKSFFFWYSIWTSTDYIQTSRDPSLGLFKINFKCKYLKFLKSKFWNRKINLFLQNWFQSKYIFFPK